MDGSQKIPMRILNSITARLDAGRASPALMRGLAGRLAFVVTETRAGRALDDDLGDQLGRLCRAARGAQAAASAILSERQVFGSFAAEWPYPAAEIARTAAELAGNP